MPTPKFPGHMNKHFLLLFPLFIICISVALEPTSSPLRCRIFEYILWLLFSAYMFKNMKQKRRMEILVTELGSRLAPAVGVFGSRFEQCANAYMTKNNKRHCFLMDTGATSSAIMPRYESMLRDAYKSTDIMHAFNNTSTPIRNRQTRYSR